MNLPRKSYSDDIPEGFGVHLGKERAQEIQLRHTIARALHEKEGAYKDTLDSVYECASAAERSGNSESIILWLWLLEVRLNVLISLASKHP